MLNTVAKRITSYQIHAYGTPFSSRQPSDAGTGGGDMPEISHHSGGSGGGGGGALRSSRTLDRRVSSSAIAHSVAVASSQHQHNHHPQHQGGCALSPRGSLASPREGDEPVVPTFDEPFPPAPLLMRPPRGASAGGAFASTSAGDPSGGRDAHDEPPGGGSPRGGFGAASSSKGDLASDARTAQFASLAEQRDLRGLEAAIGAAASSASAAGNGDGGDSVHQQYVSSAASAANLRAGGGGSSLPRTSSSRVSVSGGGLPEGIALPPPSSGGRPPLPPLTPSGLTSPHGGMVAPPQQQQLPAILSLSVMERDVLQV